MRRPRVLVTLLTGQAADLNLARRRVPHDHLVLLVHDGAAAQAEHVRAAEERLGMADRVETCVLPRGDVRRQADAMRGLLDRYRHAEVVLNAAGGEPGAMAAALYTAYDRGVETWFFQEGRAERLPILHGLRLVDRVDPFEARVLVALPDGGATSRWLAETQLIPREKVERAYRGLRKKGLVRMRAEEGVAHAEATDNGLYVREHLLAEPAVAQDRA